MADETIGRADYELRARLDQLKRDLAEADSEVRASGARTEAEYTAQSARWGGAMAKGVEAGVKVVARGASALFAVATKGAVDLENATAEFRAETGATADEAKRAGKAINEMSGRNVQGIADIGRALAKVHTDLGLTGAAAEEVTEKFLRYARVTKQDAAGAVLAFDDILDAWGLEAKDAGVIMDKLILSHQKYGGSIEANQAALAKLAPALRAANLDIDDGIGLLNLFAASGLDAADASTAMTKALAKVESPAELKALIADIIATEDPLKRAEKASELFGARAGPKLANALRPGMAALEDYQVSAADAAGATEEASDILDSTFSAQIARKIREVGAAIRGLGDDWGPMLTGAASVGTLLGSLGIDTLIRKLGPAAVEAFKKVGKAGGEALIDAAGTATGAAGTIFGNVIADPISAAMDPERNSLLGRLVRRAGDKLATVYLRALMLGDVIVAALTAMWTKVAGTTVVTNLAAAAGTVAGNAYGRAFLMALGPLAIVVLGKEAVEDLKRQLFPEMAEMDKTIEDVMFRGVKLGVTNAFEGVETWGGHVRFGRDIAGGVADGLGSGADFLKVKANALAAGVTGALAGLPLAARAAGKKTPQEIANGILESRQAPLDAFDQLLEMMKTPLSQTGEVGRLMGQLFSSKVAEGLKSKDMAVRAQAQAVIDAILARFETMKLRPGIISRQAMQQLLEGLKSKNPQIRTAAQETLNIVYGKWMTAAGNAARWGANMAAGFASGLGSPASLALVAAKAASLARAVSGYLKVQSPAEKGPFSTLGGPEGWGDRWGLLYTKGLTSSLRGLQGLISAAMPSPAVMRLAAGSVAAAPALTAIADAGRRSPADGPAAGGVTINGGLHLHGVGSDVSPAAAKRFGQSVLDEVADGLRRQARRTGLRVTMGTA